MKTIEDIKLEARVSNLIYDTLLDLIDLEQITTKDFMDVCEPLAMKIIKTVKEHAE